MPIPARSFGWRWWARRNTKVGATVGPRATAAETDRVQHPRRAVTGFTPIPPIWSCSAWTRTLGSRYGRRTSSRSSAGRILDGRATFKTDGVDGGVCAVWGADLFH